MGEGSALNADVFVEYRSLLFTIAYQITGSNAEADDVLQDSYLRWMDVDPETVDSPRSYLAKIVTRQALNHLRTRDRRRESYVGPWLPEPVRTDDQADPGADLLLAESVSMAMLVVLETLSPDERTVFVLHDVFGFDHGEIAEAVGKSPAAVRQITHRARAHVHARRRRFEPDAAVVRRVSEGFLAAAATGDVQGLLALLAPSAVLISDGGGKVNAARKPVVGAENIARFMAGIASRPLPDMRVEVGTFNGAPGVVVYSGDRADLVLLLEIADGAVTGVYIVRNPEKLTAVDENRRLARG